MYALVMGRGLTALVVVAAAALPATVGARDPADRATMAADLLAMIDPGAPSPSPTRARVAARKTLDRLGVRPLDDKQVIDAKADGATPFRGRVLGPGYQQGWLDAGAETKLEQQFLAGQRATVAVAGAVGIGQGKGAAPLVLTVVEPGEPPICRDTARACRWLPLYTQRYAITLRNTGAARIRYYLVLD